MTSERILVGCPPYLENKYYLVDCLLCDVHIQTSQPKFSQKRENRAIFQENREIIEQ